MKHDIQSLSGQRFGQLTVRQYIGMRAGHHRHWCCVCECLPTCKTCGGSGCTVKARQSRLTSGKTISCGCSKTDPERQKRAAEKIPEAKRKERAGKGAAAKARRCWIPASRAATILGVSQDRIKSLVQNGLLRERIEGGRQKISLGDVGKMIAETDRTPKRQCVPFMGG